MLTRLMLLAAQTAADLQQQLPPAQPSKLLGLSLRDILLLFGLVAILALSLYLFAYLTRRKRRRRISRSGPEMWGADRQAPQSERGEMRVRIRKKRRKHPDFRPRNPTLGETGGLPPARPDEPAQPAA
jgi:hypothetical protein